jgi:glycosyltransferase involved in cell wall biosynthesis
MGMNSKLKISVYITSYNQKEFLKDAIESVLNQTLPPYEIIIVDDYSDDGSQELILDYAKSYSTIRYSFHSTNRGVAQVRCTALEMVEGDYVTYLDGDDVYLPRKLEIESQIILSESCDIAFSNNIYVREDDLNSVQWIWAHNPIDLKSHESMFVKTLGRFYPRDSLFRMELVNYNFLKEIGFHDPELKLYEDYDLRIRMSQKGTFGYSLEPTTKIRISSHGLSTLPKASHLEAFRYIFIKYKRQISTLDLSSQNVLEKRLNQLLGESPKNDGMNELTASSRLFRRFKKLLKG